jgi:adenylate cyclase
MARLVLEDPRGERSYELRELSTVGRHPHCHVQVDDRVVSKEHCKICLERDGWLLLDTGSLNGTFVNGHRVQGRLLLRHGDRIQLGTTRARFELEGTAGTPPRDANGQTAFRRPAQPAPTVIETQLAAAWQGFMPAVVLANDATRLAEDYERLRRAHELTRHIGLERDPTKLLRRVLESMFRAVSADRGAILLFEEQGRLQTAVSMTQEGNDTVLNLSQNMMDHVVSERAAVLSHDAALDFAHGPHDSVVVNRIRSAIVAPLLHEDTVLGVLWLDSATLSKFNQRDLAIVTTIAAQAATFIQLNILSRRIAHESAQRERFRRLLSPNLAERVLSGEMQVELGGQRVECCTVFNSDIRGFTALSRGTPPETVLALLNVYFERMVQAIFRYEGTLDKFMGDGIMALWGAPLSQPDDARRAVRCALQQQHELGLLNAERQAHGEAPFAIGIGIHSGPVVAGYVGSPQALSYTVVGETANISARLCEHAAPGQIVVSETTLALLGGEFPVTELPPLANEPTVPRRFALRA